MSNLTMQSLKIPPPIFIVKIFCIFSKTRLVALYLHQAELSYVLLRVAFTKDRIIDILFPYSTYSMWLRDIVAVQPSCYSMLQALQCSLTLILSIDEIHQSFKIRKVVRHTYVDKMNDTRTYVFSSPTIQMADSSFTTSVIMADWVGSMALASSARLFSSARIRSKPYCSKHKPRYAVILLICNKNKMTCETIKPNLMKNTSELAR